MLKQLIKVLLPKKMKERVVDIKNNYLDGYGLRSYSQEGEDIILRRLFDKQEIGFYVDVGAHHPKRFSNTYFFYKKGWRGINIDAMPGSMKLFNMFRPRDINLEVGVDNKEGILEYFIFNEPALNTFNESLAKSRDGKQGYRVVDTVKIEVMPLKKILDMYLPKEKKIDFMNVDVEGMDFEVLKSNDWRKYRPKVLLVEIISANEIEELRNSTIYLYLKENRYSLFAKLFNSCLFVANEELEAVRRGELI